MIFFASYQNRFYDILMCAVLIFISNTNFFSEYFRVYSGSFTFITEQKVFQLFTKTGRFYLSYYAKI